MTVDPVDTAYSSGLRKKAQRADELERRVSEALLLLRREIPFHGLTREGNFLRRLRSILETGEMKS